MCQSRDPRLREQRSHDHSPLGQPVLVKTGSRSDHWTGAGQLPTAARGSIRFRRHLCNRDVERYEGRHVVRVERPDQITVHDAPPVPQFGPNTVRPCDPGVEKPQLTYEVPPNYTSSAIGARQEGLAFLEAVVLQDGTVGAARVLHGPRPDFGLDQEALNAVRQWRFKPGTAAKLPAAVVVTVEMYFRLK